MAHRILNEEDNQPVLNKFGTGKHGMTDVKPDRTRKRAYMEEMFQEEICRPVEAEFALAGKETTVDDPKHGQLGNLIFGVSSGQAALDLGAISESPAADVYICATETKLGSAYERYVLFFGPAYLTTVIGEDGPGSVYAFGETEDPAACVSMNFSGVCIVGTGGSIYVLDPINTLTPSPSGIADDFTGVAWNGGTNLVASAKNGNARRSTDNGATWSDAIPSGASSDDFSDVIYADGYFVMFQQNSNKVYISEDGDPANWTERTFSENYPRRATYCSYNKTIYVCTEFQAIVKSKDLFVTSTTSGGPGGAYIDKIYDIMVNDEGRVLMIAGLGKNGVGFYACSILGESFEWRYSIERTLPPEGNRGCFSYGRFFFPNTLADTRVSKRAWRGF